MWAYLSESCVNTLFSSLRLDMTTFINVPSCGVLAAMVDEQGTCNIGYRRVRCKLTCPDDRDDQRA